MLFFFLSLPCTLRVKAEPLMWRGSQDDDLGTTAGSYCETMFHMEEHPTCQLRLVSLCFFPHVHKSTRPPKACLVCMPTWLHEAYLSRHASRLYLAYGTCNLRCVGWGWLAMEDDDV